MTKYKCGHESIMILINGSDILEMSTYLAWKETTGYDGDLSECFDCHIKRIDKEMQKVKK